MFARGMMGQVDNSRISSALTQEQVDALTRFKAAKGRTWKNRLIELWSSGQDASSQDGALLRQIRNTLGPSGLAKLKL
ncbi:hypothetical protein LCGC14_0170640 [marine sediment metagenome]|uniref:Uncharacterized protein n=1 Tax=marine sediment metagenome TaxID=412755 RepID=A0A0F9USP6_9ZZZZ|nr:hypothetical protein [Oceanospirillaceae bacterium]|tara:strand:+ start:244 stop:477 length:234 start_codon:yes stop_codon:yes gene_type:complete